MKSRFSTKKRIAAVGLAGAVVLGAAGIAVAFTNGQATGTTSSGVVAASPWKVTITSQSGGPLNPNPGAVNTPITVNYTVTNTSASPATFHTTVASLNSSLGEITSGGVAVAGCWELPQTSPPSPTTPQSVVAGDTILTGGMFGLQGTTSWFTVANNPPATQSVAAGASTTPGGNFVIAMPTNAVQNQGACGSAMPDFTVTAS